MFESITQFIRQLYGTDGAIYLHEPVFLGQERKYLADCIDTGFVSTVGAYVEKFENQIANYTGARFAVSTVNGTAALHASLLVAGVKPGDEVITQALTFIATANAISYCGAKPIFLDVDQNNLGLSPLALKIFLQNNVIRSGAELLNKKTGRKIAACVPMHAFGHPADIESLMSICAEHGLPLVEDAAEALGTTYKGKHLGTFGLMGILSFNGNKILTTGGGGMILTNDPDIAKRAKHLTTTARVPSVEYIHDEVGYNYRMPNVNAALGCAQLESLDRVLENKIATAHKYKDFFNGLSIPFVTEPQNSRSNYWLNAVLFKNKQERDEFISYANQKKVFVRPAWRQLNQLEMYANCQTDDLKVTQDICDRLVNIPSGYRQTK